MSRRVVRLPDFFSDAQIAAIVTIYDESLSKLNEFHGRVVSEIIEPNLEAIQVKVGQEVDPDWLAYACEYVMGETGKTSSDDGEDGLEAGDSLRDMPEPEVAVLMNGIARMVDSMLPDGTLFTVVVFEPGGIGQFVSNCERDSIIPALRDVADRLEASEFVSRDVDVDMEDQG